MLVLPKFRSFVPIIFIAFFMCMSSIDCQQPDVYLGHACSDPSNSSADASSQSNLASLLDSLSAKASVNSFYNDSSDGVYALYLCRGDVPSGICQACVRNASQDVQQLCPGSKTAVIWHDACMIHYSNTSFFGVVQLNPGFLMWNTMNTSEPEAKNYAALSLIYDLVENVPYRKDRFGTKDAATGNVSEHRYAMVQCTRDISVEGCHDCLGKLRDEVEDCCQGKRGWRYVTPSCGLRYEDYLFYQQPSTTAPVPTGPEPEPVPGNVPVTPKGGTNTTGTNTTKIAVSIVSSVLVVGALLGFCYYRYWYSFRKRRRHAEMETSEEIVLGNLKVSSRSHLMGAGVDLTDHDESGEVYYFNLNTIRAATNDFSLENKLGEGGFGPVYKGKLPNGQEIAVKRLSMTSSQGLEEFKNEVQVIVKLQHKNLVRLLGYCLEGHEKLLVYEYLVNTSLDAFLFDPKKCKELDWEKRANIIIGTARGLLYLHEDSRLKIIHRDLKASNVLLDDELNPKISDFGTARTFRGKQIEANTEKVVGTYGYMAPEYALEGLISTKSDVYSFGILMLEIIGGKKNRGLSYPESAPSLLLHAWQLWNEGRGEELIDPNIVDACTISEVLRWIHIALLCTQDDPAERPAMSAVLLMLVSQSLILPKLATTTAPYSVGRFTTMLDQASTSAGTGTGFLASDQSTTSTSI